MTQDNEKRKKGRNMFLIPNVFKQEQVRRLAYVPINQTMFRKFSID